MFVDLIPDSLVRLFARPYVAGDSVEDALAVATRLAKGAGMASTLDLLAEEMRSREQIDTIRDVYRRLIDAIAEDTGFVGEAQRPSVSLKLSSFTLSPLDQGGDAAGSREAASELVEHAHRRGVPITIDMEDHHWTDLTLEVAIELFRRGLDVGTVLQSRLHRTEQDLARIPEGMRIRTVIGIYVEPASLALTDLRKMKTRLISQSAALLDRGVFVELATHDEPTLRRFFEETVRPRRIGGSQFEIQMLFGVPRAAILQDIRSGRYGSIDQAPPRVRLYVPFATAWEQATAYCRRRLRSNPDLALYVIRNFLGLLRGRRPGMSQYLGVNGPAASGPLDQRYGAESSPPG